MRRVYLSAIAGLAWVGIVLGHVLACVLTPAHQEVEGLHSWLPVGVVSTIALLPAIVVLLAFRAVREDSPRRSGRTGSTLAGIQLPVFLLIEVVERAASAEPLMDVALLIGFLVQVLVIAISAALVALLVKAVQAFVSRRHAFLRPVRACPRPACRHASSHRSSLFVRTRRRAPPLPLAA